MFVRLPTADLLLEYPSLRTLLTGCLLLTLHLRPAAQTTQQWSGLAVEHEVTERFGYEFEVEYRRNFSEAADGRYYALFALNWQLTDLLDITPGLRYEPPRNDEVAESRLFTDLNADLPLGESAFSLTGRLRYQYDFEPGGEVSGGSHRVRPRLGVQWQVVPRVSLAGELERRYDLTAGTWIRRRLTVGPEIKVADYLTVDLYYRNQFDFGTEAKNTVHIIGTYLSFVLPDGRIRDWKYRRPFGRQLLR